MKKNICFKQKNEIVTVCCADIVFFESMGHYISLHMKDGATHCIRGTIISLSKMINEKSFVRVHRGVVVNLGYVDKVKRNDILLNSIWKQIPVSRSYKKNLEETLALRRDVKAGKMDEGEVAIQGLK